MKHSTRSTLDFSHKTHLLKIFLCITIVIKPLNLMNQLVKLPIRSQTNVCKIISHQNKIIWLYLIGNAFVHFDSSYNTECNFKRLMNFVLNLFFEYCWGSEIAILFAIKFFNFFFVSGFFFNYISYIVSKF